MSGYHINELMRELHSIVHMIENDDIRNFTFSLLDKVSPLNWKKKASRHHHPEDERGKFGNLIHTIRVARAVVVLSEVTPLSAWDSDILKSAAVLHDCCRYGIDGEAEFSVPEHPFLVRELAKKHELGALPQVFEVIEAHMGRWGAPRFTPILELRTALHLADYLCTHLDKVKEIQSDIAGGYHENI